MVLEGQSRSVQHSGKSTGLHRLIIVTGGTTTLVEVTVVPVCQCAAAAGIASATAVTLQHCDTATPQHCRRGSMCGGMPQHRHFCADAAVLCCAAAAPKPPQHCTGLQCYSATLLHPSTVRVLVVLVCWTSVLLPLELCPSAAQKIVPECRVPCCISMLCPTAVSTAP